MLFSLVAPLMLLQEPSFPLSDERLRLSLNSQTNLASTVYELKFVAPSWHHFSINMYMSVCMLMNDVLP